MKRNVLIGAIGILIGLLSTSVYSTVRSVVQTRTVELSDGKGGGGEVVSCPVYTCVLVPLQPGQPTPTTGVPVATGTPIVGDNLLANGGFEGNARPIIFPEVNVIQSWQPYYCASGYLNYKDNCPADRRDTQTPARRGFNEPDLVMGRPEYKPSNVANRIHGGKLAQQWFNNYRVHDGGVYQTISVPIGATCEVGAYVQSWSSKNSLASDLATADDKAEYRWFLRVDPSGGVDAYAPSVLVSRPFGYSDGIYDKYVLITYQFIATGNKATVFIGSRALWPMGNVNSYVDDAYVKCSGNTTPQPTQAPPATATAIAPTNTPAPQQATPTQAGPTAQPSPTAIGSLCPVHPCLFSADLVYQVVSNGLNVRSTYKTTAPIVGSYRFAQEIKVHCIAMIDEEDTQEWASPDECDVASHWFAILINGVRFAREIQGPEG